MRKVVGLVVIVGVMVVLMGGVVYAATPSIRIGVVDISYLMNHHPKANSIRAKIKALLRENQIKFDKEVKAKKLSKKQQAELFYRMKAKLDKQEKSLLANLFKDISLAIRQIARKRHISIVFEKRSVIYGGIDITQDVLRLLKLKYPSSKKK